MTVAPPLVEQGFVGSLLIRPQYMGEMVAQVIPEDLLTPLPSAIYRAMVAMHERGIPMTMEAVRDELASRPNAAPVPERDLVELISSVDSRPPTWYVRPVLEAAARRRLITRCRQMVEMASDPNVLTGDAIEEARELLASVDMPLDAPAEAVDIATFCAGDDSYDWLVPDLIERGDRLLIVAPEGQGKSMLARQLAVCCAAGIQPFGRLGFPPVRVLLIDLENPPTLARRKLRPMHVKARELRPQLDPTNLGIIARPGGIDVNQRTDARWLASQVTAFRPDLLVLGPLYKLFAADDKWEQGARAVTVLLDDLRERIGFGLVMETHAPQGQGPHRQMRPVGSSIWLRWPEFILTFAPLDSYPDVVKVTMSKDRDERYWPKFMQRGGDWPWTRCRDPEGPKGRPEAEPDDRPVYTGPSYRQDAM